MTHGATNHFTHSTRLTRTARLAALGALAIGALAISLVAFGATAGAAAYENTVNLATSAPYSVLAGSSVTNTGASTLSGDLGISPSNSITGFPPGLIGGATDNANTAAATAQSDLTAAYVDAASRAPTASITAGTLAGGTLLPGVYNASSSLLVSGAVTLDGQGDPNSVFIFQVGSALTTASATSIVLTGAAQACHVFWQVTSSASLGSTNAFVGTIMALTSISVNNGTSIAGRALARNGAVTLINDTFTSPTCATTTTTTAVTATAATTGGTSTLTATVTPTGGGAVTGGTVTFRANGVVVGTAPVGLNGVATLVLPAGTTVGTRTITAVFNGLPSAAGSTSTATNLVVTATPLLPDTGTSHIALLVGGGGASVLLGIGLSLAARRRDDKRAYCGRYRALS